MYAIVEIAGQQFKVEKDQEIFVHRLDGEAGSTVEFDNVLLYDNDGKVSVGTPVVDGMLVKAKIVEHLKGDKVIVFHKKRRKGYQKQNGHRQYLSKIVIEDILSGAKKTAKKEEPKKEEPKKEAPKKEVKAEAKPEKKEAPKKAESKPAAKKEAPAKAEPKKAEAKKAEDKEAKTEKKAEPKKADKEEKQDDN
ncbi:MAG: 50S ribosomal protein L21 [Bacteroidales bacterium]|nr:50S ribosomal protein L21 [Bacteroidales bacterium]